MNRDVSAASASASASASIGDARLETARAEAAQASRISARLGASHPRGAALVFARGPMVSGGELDDPHGTQACAEQVAIYRARLDGRPAPKALVIQGGARGTSDGGPPCGACLQILLEFAPSARVYWGTRARPQGGGSVRQLLPGAFDSRNLEASRRAKAAPKAAVRSRETAARRGRTTPTRTPGKASSPAQRRPRPG